MKQFVYISISLFILSSCGPKRLGCGPRALCKSPQQQESIQPEKTALIKSIG